MTIAMIIAFALLAIADVITTRIGLRIPGAYEASPIGRFLIGDGQSLGRMLALKAVLVGLFVYCALGRAQSAWVDALRWAVIALLFGAAVFAVVNNLRVIRKG